MKLALIIIILFLSAHCFAQTKIQRGGYAASTTIVVVDSVNRNDTLPSKSGTFAFRSDTGRAVTVLVTGGSVKKIIDSLVLVGTVTLDLSSTAAQTSSELTATVTGATVGMAATVNSRTVNPANSSWSAYVSASNTVTVRFNNYSASSIDPASGVFSIRVTP